jgi:hypothetical protein
MPYDGRTTPEGDVQQVVLVGGGILTGKYHGHGAPERERMNSDILKAFMPERERSERIVAAADQLKTLDESNMIELGARTKCMRRRCRE